MDNKQLDQQLAKIGTPECRHFAREIFSTHAAISWTLKARYVRTARSLGYVEANRELGRLNKRLTWLDGGSIIFDDQKIKHLAILYSGAAKGIFDRTRKQTKSLLKAVYAVRTYVRENRTQSYFPENLSNRTDEQLLGLVVRTFDESFWRRHLRRISEQTVEGLLRELQS
jgi:hypothetical protein